MAITKEEKEERNKKKPREPNTGPPNLNTEVSLIRMVSKL